MVLRRGEINQSSIVNQVSECYCKQASRGKKCGQKLFEHIEKDLAATMDIGEPSIIEQRRAKGTTFSNVNVWFDSLCEFSVYFGFATGREVSDEENGELDFGENQPNRVTRLDKSVIILDSTACNKGGRLAMNFFDPYLQDAPRLAAHKNSYRATGMYGCTMMSRQQIPPIFVLPTDAMLQNQQVTMSFIFNNMQHVMFDFLFRPDFLSPEDCVTCFPIMIGMNKNGQAMAR
jgi:hypothetical protein